MHLELDARTKRAPSRLKGGYGLGLRLFRRALRAMDKGHLTVILPDGRRMDHVGSHSGKAAQIQVHDWRALRRIITGGDLGFADGYLAGEWSSNDLVALIALFADNVTDLQNAMDGFAPVRLINRLRHLLRGNNKRGSRRNIAFHYDLGNDFYRLWLDESMTYSSACALAQGQSLEQAQTQKLEQIAALLDLEGSETVLEIGCGWGALAAHLAQHCGSVTGVTLSREQLGFCYDRVASAGLANVDFRLQDYRDLDEKFDRIVSVEMLEAVGEAWWPTYFEKVRSCLKPGGTAVLQVITMREDRFESYRSGSDFIQRYVFPGGMLPTPSIISEQARRAGLVLSRADMFGAGYADTLSEWRRRFQANSAKVTQLGFDAHFLRLWEYYLSYCEAGFRSGTIDVGLYVLKG